MKYERVKERLNEHGELEAFMDSGAIVELHKGDVEWDDDNKEFYFEDGNDISRFDGTAVEGVEEHSSHIVAKP